MMKRRRLNNEEEQPVKRVYTLLSLPSDSILSIASYLDVISYIKLQQFTCKPLKRLLTPSTENQGILYDCHFSIVSRWVDFSKINRTGLGPTTLWYKINQIEPKAGLPNPPLLQSQLDIRRLQFSPNDKPSAVSMMHFFIFFQNFNFYCKTINGPEMKWLCDCCSNVYLCKPITKGFPFPPSNPPIPIRKYCDACLTICPRPDGPHWCRYCLSTFFTGPCMLTKSKDERMQFHEDVAPKAAKHPCPTCLTKFNQ